MLIGRKKSPGRDAALAIGGLALGIVGSRLLPPIFAMASGAVRSSLGEDPFDRLQADHRDILATLDKMEHGWERSAAVRGGLVLKLKRALGKHSMAEEDVVYPILNDQPGGEQAAKQLYSEHAEMKIHLCRLELTVADAAKWRENVRSVHDLIARHIRDEEEVEFPRLRAALDEKRTRLMAGKIRSEEAMVL